MGSLAIPLAFLVNTLLGLFTMAVMLRFLLQIMRADYYNPLSQLVIRVTEPVLKPLHRIIPGWRGYDFAAIALMLVLQMLNVFLLSLIYGLGVPGPLALVIFGAVKLVTQLIMLYIFTILVQVVVSWLSPGSPNPMVTALWLLNRPLLGPARRILPSPGGIDLSPMLVLIGLFFLNLLIQQLFLPMWLVRV